MMTLLLIAASSINAGQCAFQMTCVRGKQAIVMDFKSPSGDCTEDDMQATLTVGSQSAAIGFPPEWYSPLVHMLKTPTDCRDKDEAVAGYFLDESHLLFFLTSSCRPGFDNVIAALVSVKEKKLLQSIDLGKSKETLIPILKTAHGFKLRVVREHLAEVQCDCSAGFFDDWLEVRFVKNKLTSSWMK